MNGQSFSEETMLASLHDIRLPADAPGGALAEYLIAIGLAALAALVVVALLRLVLRKSVSGVPAVTNDYPNADRIALLTLLKEQDPEAYQSLRERLYRPDAPTNAELEAEVARLA